MDLDIQRFTVSADGLELGAISSDARCLRFPFTLGATDATVHVEAEVEFPSSALCGSFTYDTSSDFEIRVREPDSVLRFEPRGCEGRAAVLLVGSVHGFDYELGAGGQPLSYGDGQPPLLLDTGALALQDDGRFKLPDASGPHTATSLIAGDDFERTLIAYAPDEIARLELGVASNNEDNTRLVIRMKPWLEYLPPCDAPPGIVSVEVMTPTTCHIVVDTLSATTAEVTLGNGFELAIIDPATSACVVHAAYGDVTGTFSWPLP